MHPGHSYLELKDRSREMSIETTLSSRSLCDFRLRLMRTTTVSAGSRLNVHGVRKGLRKALCEGPVSGVSWSHQVFDSYLLPLRCLESLTDCVSVNCLCTVTHSALTSVTPFHHKSYCIEHTDNWVG